MTGKTKALLTSLWRLHSLYQQPRLLFLSLNLDNQKSSMRTRLNWNSSLTQSLDVTEWLFTLKKCSLWADAPSVQREWSQTENRNLEKQSVQEIQKEQCWSQYAKGKSWNWRHSTGENMVKIFPQVFWQINLSLRREIKLNMLLGETQREQKRLHRTWLRATWLAASAPIV